METQIVLRRNKRNSTISYTSGQPIRQIFIPRSSIGNDMTSHTPHQFASLGSSQRNFYGGGQSEERMTAPSEVRHTAGSIGMQNQGFES